MSCESASLLRECFLLALLLTGSTRRAEAAVLTAIEAEPGALLRAMITVVLRDPAHDGCDDVPPLPNELLRVIDLPETLRRCFVLRVLAGWSRQTCASVLNVKEDRIDEGLCAAARQLAALDEEARA